MINELTGEVTEYVDAATAGVDRELTFSGQILSKAVYRSDDSVTVYFRGADSQWQKNTTTVSYDEDPDLVSSVTSSSGTAVSYGYDAFDRSQRKR